MAKIWTDCQLEVAISRNKNWSGVCQSLGLIYDGRTIQILKRRAIDLKINFSHFSWKRNYEKSELENAIKNSTSYRQVLIKLGKASYGGYYEYIKRAIKDCNFDTSHFLGRHSKRIKKQESCNLEKILTEHSIYRGTTKRLKEYLIKQGIKKAGCEICGITTWCEKSVPTELDHVNGIKDDNRIENLRIVCRNCGGLLPTFCRGSKGLLPKKPYIRPKKSKIVKERKIEKQKYCLKCNKLLGKRNKTGFCNICSKTLPRLNKRKVERPSKTELQKLIEKWPFTKIGKRYGVSDNAVRKWSKNYEIILPNRLGFWTRQKTAPSKEELEKIILETPLYKVAKIYKTSKKLIKLWIKSYDLKVPDNRYRALKQWEKARVVKMVATTVPNTVEIKNLNSSSNLDSGTK